MDLPKLGTHVTIDAQDHEHVGESGTVVAYHGRLTDCVYVRLDDSTRETLVPVNALAWSK